MKNTLQKPDIVDMHIEIKRLEEQLKQHFNIDKINPARNMEWRDLYEIYYIYKTAISSLLKVLNHIYYQNLESN